MHRLYRQAVALQGREAVEQGWADPACVAADKSLVAGLGPRWHAADGTPRSPAEGLKPWRPPAHP